MVAQSSRVSTLGFGYLINLARLTLLEVKNKYMIDKIITFIMIFLFMMVGIFALEMVIFFGIWILKISQLNN